MSFFNPGAMASARMSRTRSRKADNLADDDAAGEDHYARAPGAICEKCDRMIEARQIARRRGETGWVHDMCPVVDG